MCTTCNYRFVFAGKLKENTHRYPKLGSLATVYLSNINRLRFQALWAPKYIWKFTSGCVSLLFTAR